MNKIIMIVNKEFEKDADGLIKQIEKLETKVYKIVLEESEFKDYMISCSCDKTKTLELDNGKERV